MNEENFNLTTERHLQNHEIDDTTMKIFSDELLRQLRNQVPITYVLSAITHQEIRKDHNGRRRFQCAKCKKFDTIINKESNLAYCFGCKKARNPIDLVMVKFNITFRQAVVHLIDHSQFPSS